LLTAISKGKSKSAPTSFALFSLSLVSPLASLIAISKSKSKSAPTSFA
jgi:hypothetical protein